VAVVVQAGKRERRVNYIGSKAFAGEAVGGGNTGSFVGGKARMVKTVQDVEGSLGDPAGGEEVTEDMMAEQQHELAAVEGRDGFEGAVGRPNAATCDGVDMGMQVETIAVALHGKDDARDGG
jgi:hypothetical protein